MKKTNQLISMIVIIGMVMTTVAGLSGITALAAFGTGVVVEAESGTLANVMKVFQSATASGGLCITSAGGGRLDDPQNLATPDATYTFTIPTRGDYKIYMHGYAANDGTDSYWYRWDSNAYVNQGAVTSTDWRWQESTATTTLTAGTHTLNICHRESGYYIDFLVIATSLSQGQKDAIDAAIVTSGGHYNPSTAVNYNTSGGSVLFEAESTTLTPSLFSAVADASASGGSAASALITQGTVPDKSLAGLEFNITPDRTESYDLWVRYSATAAQNSLYLSVDDSVYGVKDLTASSGYTWAKLQTTAASLRAGIKYNFKIHPAKAGLRIDKIIVTSYPFYTPSGNVTSLDNSASTYALSSAAYPAPTITPPPEHPRLYFRASDIPAIKANMQKSQNAAALTAYKGYLATNVDGILTSIIDKGVNYNTTVMATIEAYALKYALDGDATYGNKAISAIKNYLNTVILEEDTSQDITRPMGHTIYVAAAVYDWCYPLLTAADKNYIIVACESIAKKMEVGYPPWGQGAVTGHGGEMQLFRDQLSLGVAAYDERPDIYNYVAGRLLSQFIAPRNYWYASHTHHQGDSYGAFRYVCEMTFQWIMKRMSGQTVFSPEGEFVPYQWIYTRRPDGQSFRDGDNFLEPGTTVGNYWSNDRNALFYSSNFYGNSYVKGQFIGETPGFNGFSLGNGILTPVSFLLFNNPDLTGQSQTSFPLTNYFGSPYGMMIARTGWLESGQVNLSSNIAMAQMIIGEQWAANHQHLDAGSFQLYYKGALASESGIYDDYGSNHDKNYNKETIAHNALLVYDPNESMNGGIVNSGGQRRAGGEVGTFSQWMSAGYDIGKVLDQGYDKSGTVPAYSYIKGDITRAYTGKVSQVLRSMLFMPLSDASHPAAFVVMDKVTASNPTFKKTWLLHTQQDPVLSGSTAVVKRDTNGYNGRMDLTTLLPVGASLTKVGGAGNEFNINGVNYPPATYGNTGCEYGTWRIEVSPSTAQATDYFLNVMQVSDASANATPLAATLIETNLVAGAKISDRVAVFAKGRDRITGALDFTVPGSEPDGLELTVCGLEEGQWKIYQGLTYVGSQTADAQSGVLSFDGGAGNYTLLHTSSEFSTSLLSLSYDGGENLLGSGAADYTVQLGNGVTVVPVVYATPADPTSAVVITQAAAIPGMATVVVTSSDGLASKTYTISFTRPKEYYTSLSRLTYTFEGQAHDIDLAPDDAVGGFLQENRYTITLPYYTKAYAAGKLPAVAAVPLAGTTMVAAVQTAGFPGTALVTVAAANGDVRKYYVHFNYSPGNITALTNKAGVQTYKAYHDLQPMSLADLRDLYLDVGAKWENYCRSMIDRGLSSSGAVVDTAANSGGDKIPSKLIPLQAGKTGDFIKNYQYGTYDYFVMWMATGTSAGNSSPFFNGASWIAAGNNDKVSSYMMESHDDAITFTIDRGATVWLAARGALTNYESGNGWTKSTSGYKLYHGDGTAYATFYTKHFDAGAVKIPTPGGAGAGDRMYIPLVMWDAPGTGNTALASLQVTESGETREIPIVAGQNNYTVTATVVPTVGVTLTDPAAEARIDQAQALPGNATIQVVSGANTTVYTIAFQLPAAVQYGDIDADGEIDISDVIMAAEIAVGSDSYTPAQVIRANVSGKEDPTVDISDVVLIAERAVGSTVPFPVE